MSILDFVAGCAGYCSVWLQKSHDGGYMAAYPRKLEPLKTTTSHWNLVWKGIMHSITWSNHCSLNIKTARKKKRLKITETVQAMARFGSKPIAREMRTLQTHIINIFYSELQLKHSETDFTPPHRNNLSDEPCRRTAKDSTDIRKESLGDLPKPEV